MVVVGWMILVAQTPVCGQSVGHKVLAERWEGGVSHIGGVWLG